MGPFLLTLSWLALDAALLVLLAYILMERAWAVAREGHSAKTWALFAATLAALHLVFLRARTMYSILSGMF